MTNSFKSVLGDDWFQTFLQFRLNPDPFFDRRKLTREGFCLDVLRDIYLDHIDIHYKIRLLLLLQEHSTSLIKDINLLEQIAGSLMNLFSILKGSENKLFRSQILITVTTLLLTTDVGSDTEGLLSSVRKLLLGIIVDGSDDPVILSAACKAFEEIEVYFPTVLELEMKNILSSCEIQLSPAFQDYALLLSLYIKHLCEKSSKIFNSANQFTGYWTIQPDFNYETFFTCELRVNKVLALVSLERLKTLGGGVGGYVPESIKIFQKINMARKDVLSFLIILNDENGANPYEKGRIQIPAVVSYLLELIPLMSPMSAYRVMKNLMLVVKDESSISSMVFKLFLPNLIFSSEVSYFHLAFDFLEAFRTELFTAQEEKCLLRQLVLLSSHPCLTMSHRMLFLDWLRSCLLNKEFFLQVFHGSIPIFKSLLPSPFDGPITQEKKSCILALCVPKNEDKSLDCLNESISGLKKCALLPGGMKAAASFFRTLYLYFSFHKSKVMHDYMYRLLLSVMKTSPHLLPYALNFLHSVKMEFPESTFPKEALTHLVDHILSLPMKQFLNNLECYLAILEQASEVCGSESKPRSILRLLQKLLTDSDIYKRNTWEFGNNVLSVCQSILTNHDVQFFYYDLAEVLCLISQNVNDVDVKDRAKIYYSALTTLSKLKVQSIFKMHSPKKDPQNSLTSFVPGVNTNLQFAPCIQVLTKPILKLVRIRKTWNLKSEDSITEQSLPDIDVLKVYQQHLNSSDSLVRLPFILKHISESEIIFTSLYGVVISTESSSPCKKISATEIPVFKCSRPTDEENVLHIEFTPNESQPTELQFKVEFNCSNGFSYICYPDPVFLNFKDFFLRLPVPNTLQNSELAWRKHLFEILWEDFEEKANSGFDSKKFCKSAYCLKASQEELLSIIDKYWKPFVVSRFNDLRFWVAIFLPPRSHLLMKIDNINGKPFISILIDDTSILPWLALYLQEITKC